MTHLCFFTNKQSLVTTSLTPVALERARQHSGEFALTICIDKQAVKACIQFSKDHRMLVEPACGAALAVAYDPQ